METVAFVLALVVMLVGVIGVLLPAIPGIPLIWVAMLVYGLFDGFEQMSVNFLVVTFVVVVGAQVAEHYAKAWGAQRFGAGRAGTWGAVIGSIIGIFFMPLGLVVGPFAGALLGELLAGRPTKEAMRAGWGGLVGVLGSVVINFMIAIALTVSFIVRVLTH